MQCMDKKLVCVFSALNAGDMVYDRCIDLHGLDKGQINMNTGVWYLLMHRRCFQPAVVNVWLYAAKVYWLSSIQRHFVQFS